MISGIDVYKSWEEVPEDFRTKIYQEYKSGIDIESYAKQLSIKKGSLKRALRRHRQKIESQNPDVIIDLNLKARKIEKTIPVWDDFEVLHSDNAMIIGDLEMPAVDLNLLRKVVQVAMSNDIKTLIIAGDLIASDQAGLASHDITWASEEMTFEKVLEYTRIVLRIFLGWFDHIVVFMGNHDERVSRVTGGHVWLGMLLDDPRITFSRYEYMYMVTKRKPVYICHPRGYSRNSSKLGKDLYNANSYNGQKCDIILAHTHLRESAHSQDGIGVIHAMGCCRAPSKTKYISTRSTTFPKWRQGFAMIRNAYIYNFDFYETDWDFWVGKEYQNVDIQITQRKKHV